MNLPLGASEVLKYGRIVSFEGAIGDIFRYSALYIKK